MLPIIENDNHQEIHLTITEFCRVVHADHDIITDMIEYEIICPQGEKSENWQFDALCITRAKHALSFMRDLEVNMPGAALALQLLDEIAVLKKI